MIGASESTIRNWIAWRWIKGPDGKRKLSTSRGRRHARVWTSRIADKTISLGRKFRGRRKFPSDPVLSNRSDQ